MPIKIRGSLLPPKNLIVSTTKKISSTALSCAENSVNCGLINIGFPINSCRIIGGADSAKFNVTNLGQVVFKTAPNYEAPASAAGSNSYSLQVQVSSSSYVGKVDVVINVTNVAEHNTLSHNGLTWYLVAVRYYSASGTYSTFSANQTAVSRITSWAANQPIQYLTNADWAALRSGRNYKILMTDTLTFTDNHATSAGSNWVRTKWRNVWGNNGGMVWTSADTHVRGANQASSNTPIFVHSDSVGGGGTTNTGFSYIGAYGTQTYSGSSTYGQSGNMIEAVSGTHSPLGGYHGPTLGYSGARSLVWAAFQ